MAHHEQDISNVLQILPVYQYLMELKRQGGLGSPDSAEAHIRGIFFDQTHPYHNLVLSPDTGPIILGLAKTLGGFSGDDMHQMLGRFEAFLRSETISERFAFGPPPLSQVMQEMFPHRTPEWHNQAELTTQEVLQTMQSLSPLPDQLPYAYLHGSIARRMFGTPELFDNVANTLREAVQALPVDTDDHIVQSLRPFAIGPNDIDLRFDRTSNMTSTTIFETLQARFSQADQVHVSRFIVLEGMDVIEVTMRSPEQPLSIHIIEHPEGDQKILENRFADHLTHKRLLTIPITGTPENPCIFRPELIGPLTDLDVRMCLPSTIQNPHYLTIDQCLYAALSLIRHELLWPSYTSERIEPSTVEGLRSELMRHIASAVKSKHTVASEYRIGELIREGVLCLTIDPQETMRMMDAIGISDSLGLRFNPIYQDLVAGSVSREAFHKLIISDPEYLKKIAQLFDISALVQTP